MMRLANVALCVGFLAAGCGGRGTSATASPSPSPSVSPTASAEVSYLKTVPSTYYKKHPQCAEKAPDWTSTLQNASSLVQTPFQPRFTKKLNENVYYLAYFSDDYQSKDEVISEVCKLVFEDYATKLAKLPAAHYLVVKSVYAGYDEQGTGGGDKAFVFYRPNVRTAWQRLHDDTVHKILLDDN